MTPPPDLDSLRIPPALRPFADAHLAGPDPLVRIAEMLALTRIAEGVEPGALIDCALALRRAAPTRRLVWALTDLLLHTGVHGWHWRIVADAVRNEAYDRALRAAVRRGMAVLEIGTGTGILAMMAARAGAGHVFTIERDPRLARVAREAIAANGFEDRITVVEADALTIGAGGPVPRCDAFVHEIISTNLLAEGVLALTAHARAELLSDTALLLPRTIWTNGVLAGGRGAGAEAAPKGAGFDLSALDMLQPSGTHLTGGRGRGHLSAPARLATFDLADLPGDGRNAQDVRNTRGTHETTLIAAEAGTARGVIQWPGFDFPDGTAFDGAEPTSCWGALFHAFGTARSVAPGDAVGVRTLHAGNRLAIELI